MSLHQRFYHFYVKKNPKIESNDRVKFRIYSKRSIRSVQNQNAQFNFKGVQFNLKGIYYKFQ